MSAVREGDRTGRPGEFLHGESVLEVALAEATIFWGDGNAQETHLAESFPEILRVQWGVSGSGANWVTGRGIPSGKCSCDQSRQPVARLPSQRTGEPHP